MVLSIGENLSSSFEFAKDGLVGYWLRWIILIVVTCIPIVNFITYGYLVKIYKGGDIAPELEDYGEMFIDGIQLAIIGIIYIIIPIILITAGVVFAGFGGLVLLSTEVAAEAVTEVIIETADEVAMGTASVMIGLLLILIGIVLVIIIGLVATVAGIRFAKTEKFGEGFNFRAIFATLKEIGWGHYILSYIAFIIVVCIVAAIASLIPIIGWLLMLIITPLLILWQGKFFENLYSCA